MEHDRHFASGSETPQADGDGRSAAPAVEQGMKALRRLPFERAYLLEAVTCRRCDGTGHVTGGASSRFGPRCYNCKGLGRIVTRAGAALFQSVCKLLGAEAVIDEHRRIEPNVMRAMFAQRAIPGMRVRLSLNQIPIPDFKNIVDVERPSEGAIRILFEDGSLLPATTYTMLSRELTADELDRADVWMAQHIGRGAVEATS